MGHHSDPLYGHGTSMLYRFREFELDPERFELRRSGVPLATPRQVFDLLHFLIVHRTRPATRDDLIAGVWDGRIVSETSITRCVSDARKLVGDTPARQDVIRTVHGRGYWFVASVEEVDGGCAEPPIPDDGSPWPFVGRAFELRRANEQLARTAEGPGSLLLVSGEPGIGKTRTAAEIARTAFAQGFRVVHGACQEVTDPPPAWPWVQVLRALEGACGFSQGEESVRRAFREVHRVLPELVPGTRVERAPRPDDAAAARLRVFEYVMLLLRASGDDRPLVVILDDLHRADRFSLQLLRFASRDLTRTRMLVVGTWRDTDATGRESELRELGREAGVATLALRGLNVEEAATLVERAGLPHPEEAARVLVDHSGGNPFFLSQLLSLHDLGERLGGSHLAPLPRTLTGSALAHVERLPEACRTLLSAASVCGREFTTGELAAVAETSTGEALDGLQPAIRAGALRRSGSDGLRFTHVLLRDALYAEVPAGRRCQMHRIAADFLEARFGMAPGAHSASAAHHHVAAGALGDADRGTTHLVAAARWASDRLAYDEAADHCTTALALVEKSADATGEREFDVLLALAEAQLRAGLREEGRSTLHRVFCMAETLGSRDRIADAALAIAPGFFSIETGVVDPLLVSTLEDALTAIGPEPSLVRVRLLCQLAFALYWSDSEERRTTLVEEAEAAAEALGDPEAMGYVAVSRFGALWSPENFGARMSSAGPIVRAARHAGDPSFHLLAQVFRIATTLEAGDVLMVDQLTQELEEVCKWREVPSSRWYPGALRAGRLLMEGRFDGARREIEGYVAEGSRLGDANVFQSFLLHTAELLWQMDEIEAWLPAVESHAMRFSANLEWRCALSFLYQCAGRTRAARSEARRMTRRFGDVFQRMNGRVGLAALAWVVEELRDRDAAEVLLQYAPFEEGQHVIAGFGVLYWGPAELTAGLLYSATESWGPAEESFEQALHSAEGVGSRPWMAYVQYAYARSLLVRSDPDGRERAAELAHVALETSEELGLRYLSRRLGELVI